MPSRKPSWGLVVGTALAVVLMTGLVIQTRGADSGSGVETAPQVTLLYFDGATESLSDLVGQPVVLNFWASWCPACISEMPAFAEAHSRFGDRVRFVGINMQEVNLDAAIDLAESTGVQYQLAHDPDGAIYRAFGGLAMPTTVFIDADGSVTLVRSGVIFLDDLTAIIEDSLLG
ncbi:MAG: TlpA family protein disulfide reductase [Acidimicrobiia bacterium]